MDARLGRASSCARVGVTRARVHAGRKVVLQALRAVLGLVCASTAQ